jgi:predicted alpha/beta-fold hydrolase
MLHNPANVADKRSVAVDAAHRDRAGADLFRPPWGLRHAHIQSILSSWPARTRGVRRRAERMLSASRAELLTCAGGVRLLGYRASPTGGARGLVVLLHGWEGSADSHYVLSGAAALYEAGYEVFRLNFRDHGDTESLNRELFHSCRIDEVIDAVRIVQRSRPRSPLFLVGFSLGGNFAARIAALAPHAGLCVAKAVAVCPVLNPRSTMHALENGLWIYRHYFLRRWRLSLLAKAAEFPDLYDFGDLRRFKTITATTDFFVRCYTDFPDLDAYLVGYAITGKVLADLSIPTHIIATKDDPVIPSADLAALHPSTSLTVTLMPYGGHCGFLDGYRLTSWVDGQLLRELSVAARPAGGCSPHRSPPMGKL